LLGFLLGGFVGGVLLRAFCNLFGAVMEKVERKVMLEVCYAPSARMMVA
jgi:hypothetical protein